MQLRIRVVLLLLAPLLLGACGAVRSMRGDSEDASVRVQNQAFNDMTIYVVAGSQEIRLGTATGNSTTTLRIPSTVVGIGRELSFRADPIGSSAVASSYSIFVDPGDEVTLTIPPGGG